MSFQATLLRFIRLPVLAGIFGVALLSLVLLAVFRGAPQGLEQAIHVPYTTQAGARAALGTPSESGSVNTLPMAYRMELKRLALEQASTVDKFTEFRGGSLPAAPGVAYLYVVYDTDEKVVRVFRQFVD